MDFLLIHIDFLFIHIDEPSIQIDGAFVQMKALAGPHGQDISRTKRVAVRQPCSFDSFPKN